jgi:Na+/melibiose symporter-like transporter
LPTGNAALGAAVPAKEPKGWQIAVYAATTWPLTIGQQPMTFLIPFYSFHFGLDLAVLGALLTAGRVFDLFADVSVAYLSDRYRTRFGRRRPWVVVGLLLFIPAMWFLFVPGDSMTLGRYGLALFLFFITWTMGFIPYMVHGTELSRTHEGKSAINVAQGVGNSLAVFGSFAIPLAFTDPATYDIRARLANFVSRTNFPWRDTISGALHYVTPPGIAGYGTVMYVVVMATSVAIPFLLVGYAFGVPDTSVQAHHERSSLFAAFRNRVFTRFAFGYLLVISAYFGTLFLLPFLLEYIYGASNLLLRLSMMMTLVQIVIAPAWYWLLARMERKHCMALAAIVQACSIALFIATPKGNVGMLYASFLAFGLTAQTLMMSPFLIAADCADYSRWRTKTDSRAVHISLVSLLIKAGMVAGALFVSLVGIAGLVPSNATQTPFALTALRVVGLILPCALLLVGAVIIATHPITRNRHKAIQRRIDRRITGVGPHTL